LITFKTGLVLTVIVLIYNLSEYKIWRSSVKQMPPAT
jgi:hypothetical protein